MHRTPSQEENKKIPQVQYGEGSIVSEVLSKPVVFQIVCVIIILILGVVIPIVLYWAVFVVF